jgi:hypothetical protein
MSVLLGEQPLTFSSNRRGREGGTGSTGHAEAWQQVAFSLEDAGDDREFLDLRLDLQRENSWAHELWKSGRKIDKQVAEQTRKWSMSVSKVELGIHILQRR